ncbi:hypothetical protein [Kitasatospora sp. NPDC094015]|uniref:hypothetical protein n=1 Tax=Kitasatospora sp. NPDC094015 TaxID=3155205 RepID=UPI00331AA04F
MIAEQSVPRAGELVVEEGTGRVGELRGAGVQASLLPVIGWADRLGHSSGGTLWCEVAVPGAGQA